MLHKTRFDYLILVHVLLNTSMIILEQCIKD